MNAAAQHEWLVTHLPHRIRAAISRLPLEGELLTALSATEPQKIRERCEGNAIWEGRMAAVRWLIEFIGVKEDKHGKPVRPNPRGADASITMIAGGTLFDMSSPDAIFLARVWRGCSQASSHATHASGHPSVEPSELDRAMRIMTAHLDQTIYSGQSRNSAASSLHLEKQ